jgi:hypothetical protein
MTVPIFAGCYLLLSIFDDGAHSHTYSSTNDVTAYGNIVNIIQYGSV